LPGGHYLTVRTVGFVAFGDVFVVEFAFRFDTPGEVFGSGASAFGHHQTAVTGHRVAELSVPVLAAIGWRWVGTVWGTAGALPGLVV
jgi:hypothetical protein